MSAARAADRSVILPEVGRDDSLDRPHPKDLALELFRQRTLLQILSGRMRETSAGLERVGSFDPARLRRALDAHRRFLREVHLSDGKRLAEAIPPRHSEAAWDFRRALGDSEAKAAEFERKAESLVAREGLDGTGEARRLSKLFAEEADRIEQFQVWEADQLHPSVVAWLPKTASSRLLAQLRRFDAARIDAEIALIAWASQLHPSAD